MSDIIKDLRSKAELAELCGGDLMSEAFNRAADEIERLNRVLASVDASTDLKTARRRAFAGATSRQP